MAELDLTAIAETSILTPAAGVGANFFESTNKILSSRDDTGFVRSVLTNWSTVAQTPVAATRTYLTGSALKASAGKFQIGTLFRWRFNMTKTGAGVAASTIDICFGTNGSTADVARVSFAKPAGTAVIDEAWCDIIATVRGPISAAAVVAAQFIMSHNGNTVGHAVIPIVVVNTISAGFDLTVANLIAGVCITTGAADAITIQLVQADAINL